MQLFHITALITWLFFALLPMPLQAGSTRVQVYALASNYYDTQAGDTLSTITQQLLQNNPNLRAQLAADILRLNPQAFIDNNPDRLLAGRRLQMPGYLTQAERPAAPTVSVEHYSWGNIKRPRDPAEEQ
ncbi:MAG TPA: hypothetical protein ENJ64_00170 [Thiotrichales bacterium]|nr:hypothetical protein [Thiotrichales bacterium]